jgi:L-threonylcarbamoyladenylate synthase
MPQLLSARDGPDLQAALPAAVRSLADGGLVAFPTETVYGLGARADNAAAVAGIFTAKGRPSDHPLIVHVADAAGAEAFAADLPPVARRLMAAFWPGPLTVIVPRRPNVAAAAAGGQATVGLRCPDHPVAQALLRAAAAAGVPGVAAPSANRFGQVSPTRAGHVMSEFPALPDLLVLDGGPCAVGIESAIVDCSRGRPVLLRPGGLTAAAIAAAAGEPLGERGDDAPRASGTLEAHYAPRAKLRLMDLQALRAGLQVLLPGLRNAASPTSAGPALAVYCHDELPDDLQRSLASPALRGRVRLRRMPADAATAAQELFAALREFDDGGVPLIWVEAPPADPAWDGVRDRLQRAAAAA